MKIWLTYTLRTAVTFIMAVLLATSCSQDNFDEPIAESETAIVSFNSTIEYQTETRAWDASNVDKLYFELYLDDKIIERLEFDVVDGNVDNFQIELLKNMTYTAVFWAQKEGCSAYNFTNLNNISINYDSTTCSDFAKVGEKDAFHAACTFTVNTTTINEGVDVRLTRPFALVTVGVNPSNFSSGTTSSITLNKVATSFNAVTGTASNGDVKTLNFAPDGTTTVPGKSQTMLAMAYILPLKNSATDITIRKTVGSQTEEKTLTINKLEANKRYNILSAE